MTGDVAQRWSRSRLGRYQRRLRTRHRTGRLADGQTVLPLWADLLPVVRGERVPGSGWVTWPCDRSRRRHADALAEQHLPTVQGGDWCRCGDSWPCQAALWVVIVRHDGREPACAQAACATLHGTSRAAAVLDGREV